MSFLEELKRRNVFKVGIAYAVIAWLVLQASDIILNNVKAPGWVFFVILLLGVGFLFALFFAWAFELTPEGLKRESEVDRTQSITPQTGKKLNLMITVVMALALTYFTYDKFFVSAGRQAAAIETVLESAQEESAAQALEQPSDNQKATAADDKSIAVLPFVNMSSDPEQDYFSDGISEEILNALAQVHNLKVAGLTSSFSFKGHNEDLRTIGKTLGVTHILEGSVRKAGEQVRITAQLIKIDDGFHMWSATYDRKLTDVFAIQDEISSAILKELKAALLDGNTPQINVARADSKAYDLYLLAKQRMYERTELKLQSAADLLDKAIAIDPAYAPAYAQRGIAAQLLSETAYGTIPQNQSRVQAKLYLDKALALDENLAEAWAGLGLYYNGPPFEPAKGIPVLEKALTINPNLINASNWLTLNYWGVNRVTGAMALLDDIAARDPLYRPAIGNRVFMLALMGKGDQARAFMDKLGPFLRVTRISSEIAPGLTLKKARLG